MSTTAGDNGADYADKDLPGGDVDPGEGTYTDQETPQEERGEEPDPRGPGDRGGFTDSDHVAEHRARPAAGGYTSKDTSKGTSKDTGTDPSNEVEENPHG